MSLASFELPKGKEPWIIGGAVALALLFSGVLGKKSAPATDGVIITPADLLDAIRTSSGAAAGAANAGVAAGGSIAVAGLSEGGRVADSALSLAGSVVGAQERVTETAVGSLSRSIDSTLAVLAKLADSAARTFTPPSPQPYTPPPVTPPPSQPVQPVGTPPPAPSPAPTPTLVRYGGYATDAVAPTPTPSKFEQSFASDVAAHPVQLTGLHAPLQVKLVTGEWVTVG